MYNINMIEPKVVIYPFELTLKAIIWIVSKFVSLIFLLINLFIKLTSKSISYISTKRKKSYNLNKSNHILP